MDEYIDREAAIAKCREIAACEWNHRASPVSWADAYEQFAEDIEEIPAADVAPVRHGRWGDSIDEWVGTDVYTCSKCRESYVLVEGTPKENLWHYCPNCGAKMEGCADNE